MGCKPLLFTKNNYQLSRKTREYIFAKRNTFYTTESVMELNITNTPKYNIPDCI